MSEVLHDPIPLFDECFPKSLQEVFLDILRRKYAEYVSATRSVIREPHDRDVFGDIRRGLIEGEFERSVAGLTALGARIEKNRSSNSHVVIEAGNFILTESFARGPRQVVRWAAFREADSLANYPLFRNLPPDEISADQKFNAVLLHGHRPGNISELGFAVIRFPKPGFKGYLPDLINLFDRFPLIPSIVEPDAMEEIPDTLEPRIRTDQPDRKDL